MSEHEECATYGQFSAKTSFVYFYNHSVGDLHISVPLPFIFWYEEYDIGIYAFTLLESNEGTASMSSDFEPNLNANLVTAATHLRLWNSSVLEILWIFNTEYKIKITAN